MRKTKRGGGDLTRSLHKNRRARNGGGAESLVSGYLHGDSNQDVWTGLSDGVKSNLSKSVASLTLCNGDTVLFACSGIAIERQECLTRFLTSASLVRALNGTNKGHDDLKIEVRHEGNGVYQGYLAEFDLDHNFAVVNIRTFLDVHVGLLQHAVEILPRGKVVAVGRDISGKLMARSVVLIGDSSVSEDSEDLNCQISEAWEGGPLFSFDGNFVGMNLFLAIGRTFFISWGTIHKRLQHYWTSLQKKIGLPQSKSFKVYRFGTRPIGERSNSHPEVHRDLLNQEQFDLDSMGYPKLPTTMLGAGMVLVSTFEGTFGDICGEGVWSKLSKKASSNIDRNVVALASFNGDFTGEKRLFACTGFFIEWNGSTIILTSASLVRNSGDENKIVENMRIEVLLPNKRRREGTLQHYSLHYNVALVSVKDYRALRPANIQLDWRKCFKVAAVGRCFKSGALMAASGQLVPWTGTLDCEFLVRSSCKITKAGIGGPLITPDGEVIGMNFYDRKIGTPFLLWERIRDILASFEKKSKVGEVGNDSDPSGVPFWKMAGDDKVRLNRWPVPMPCWRHPDYVDEDKSEDDDELGFEGKLRYDYINGVKAELF